MYLDLLQSALAVAGPLMAQEGPEPEDVKAGWTAFAVFGLLILAVVVLGFSLTKRLKNVERADAAGLYDPSDKNPEKSQGPAPE
ncbi:MAG: hypothetical protein WKF79_05070 [Nocardioides sp.]